MSALPQPILDALEFKKTNWANGSVFGDAFYDCPAEAAHASPGSLLRVEKDVNTSSYLLPPATALSRIIYQSETLYGLKVPVSAFILWPYSPNIQPDGYPVVAWAHGTSGGDPNTAPSNHKNLWQHFHGPYQLALNGYVVVGTDYAGLGLHKDLSGKPIMHEYLASPSQANDVVHSVSAAQSAFPELSKDFVVIGHSQGGGAAWAVAQKAATSSIPGYLGAIAVSPYTNFMKEQGPNGALAAAAMCRSIASVYPDFKPEDVLNQEGEIRVKTMFGLGMGFASALALFYGSNPVKPDWKENEHLRKYADLTRNGGKQIEGPLLVIHGEADPMNLPASVDSAVQKTAELFPKSQLEYVSLPHVTHQPALAGSQRLWMSWIRDRFAGVHVEPGFMRTQLTSARPGDAYHSGQNWYLQPATQFYHAP